METITDEAFRKTLENNILSNHWIINFARPHLIAQGGGSVMSPTQTSAPSIFSSEAFSGERASTTTLWPRVSSCLATSAPTNPVAPVTK